MVVFFYGKYSTEEISKIIHFNISVTCEHEKNNNKKNYFTRKYNRLKKIFFFEVDNNNFCCRHFLCMQWKYLSIPFYILILCINLFIYFKIYFNIVTYMYYFFMIFLTRCTVLKSPQCLQTFRRVIYRASLRFRSNYVNKSLCDSVKVIPRHPVFTDMKNANAKRFSSTTHMKMH